MSWLKDYWHMQYYEDNKETNLRLFKLKLEQPLVMLMIIYLKKYFGLDL